MQYHLMHAGSNGAPSPLWKKYVLGRQGNFRLNDNGIRALGMSWDGRTDASTRTVRFVLLMWYL